MNKEITDRMDVLKDQQLRLEELDQRIDLLLNGEVSSTKSEKPSLKRLFMSKTNESEISVDELIRKAHERGIENTTFSDLLTREEQKEVDRHYKEVEEQFSRLTGITTKEDISLVIIATALQVLRWTLAPELGEKIDKAKRLTASEGDELVRDKKEKYIKQHEQGGLFKIGKWDKIESPKHKNWNEIIVSGVPYDATANAAAFGVNMGGGFHRIKTLGHDPLLGWIFGTVNILSDTITLNDLRTFVVAQGQFQSRASLPYAFAEAFDSISEDKNRLPAAIFRQGVHFASDRNTKYGLPVPVLGTFSEQLAGNVYRSQYDELCARKDIKKISMSLILTQVINMIISLIHGLFYDEKSGLTRDQYEVRTRKILLISGTIAESSNLITCAITKNTKKLDIGGLVVLISRWFSDSRFISSVKKEFIEKEFTESIQGKLSELDEVSRRLKR